MSTATKLEYLNDTKSLLKNSINSLGGEITSQTTFRQYATELDSIYASLPKVSGTGTNISLSPTRKGRITSQINGDTLQDGTPTPDASIEIQSVTGLQKVGVCGKNLFDGIFELGGYTISNGNKGSSNDRIRTPGFIKVNPNQTYSLSFENTGSVYVLEYDKNKTYLNKYTLVIYHILSGNFTTSADTEYITFYYIPYQHELSLNEKCQLELGSTATTYEAYSGETYDINLGKNLFDGEYKNLALWSTTANVNTTFAGNNNNYVGAYIKVESGETYSISRAIETNRFTVSFSIDEPKNGGATLVYNTGTGKKFENITVPNGYNYLFVYLSNSGEDTTNLDLQIEKGTQATPYSEYFTPIELNKIGDYKDYITGTPDNWSIVKAFGKQLLNGTETNISIYSSTATRTVFRCPTPNVLSTLSTNNQYIISSHFISKKQSATLAYGDVAVRAGDNDLYYTMNTGETVETFKTWLSNNNVITFYPTTTPTTTPITDTTLINDLNAFYYAKSKQGQTNISVDGDLPIILDVSALKYTE